MSTRKPLVVIDGQVQQLPAGDDLGAPPTSTRSMTNGEVSAALVVGTPVYVSAADAVKKAKADALATAVVYGLMLDVSTAAGAIGHVVTDDVMSASTAQWDAVTGDSGGLTAGARYFLDAATAGKLTKTAPTLTGHVVVQIGIAKSATEMEVEVSQTILL